MIIVYFEHVVKQNEENYKKNEEEMLWIKYSADAYC